MIIGHKQGQIPVLRLAVFIGWMLVTALPALAAQSPPGCSANNLNVNIGVRANNVTNGTTVTWVVTVENPALPTSCDVTLGPEGLFFICPGSDGNPTGQRTTLIPGGTTLQPGFGLETFEIPCLVNVSGVTAEGKVSAPGSVVHKNPIQDDPANVDKTISVNVFRPCIQLRTACISAINTNGSLVTVTYNGTVENCGNVFLNDVEVFADKPAPNTRILGPIVLQAGASTNFTVSYTTTDLCGPFNTALVANGTAPLDTPVEVTASASSQCTISYQPAITVTKVCPTAPVQPGEVLAISGVVRNSGNIALQGVVVINNKPNENTVLLGPISLGVGESANYTGSYVVPLDSCPPYADTVAATGTATCGGQTVSSQASASCQGTNSPSIQVTKACPTSPVPPGERLTYTGTVTNTGNITLTDVVVVSDQPNPNTRVFGPVSLAPGAGAVFTASYNVPGNSCGPYTSTLSATGDDKCFGRTVTSSATAVCPGITVAGIEISKTCPSAPVQPGGTLNYSGTVRNTGDVTLTNVTVYNGATLVFGPASLNAGATQNFNGSYTVPPDSCGPYSDTLVAAGISRCGDTVTDSVTVPCPGTNSPAIKVTRSCPPNPVQPGATLTYTGTVTNSGNITLNNVRVVANSSPNTVVFEVASLAPGQGASFTGSYVVPLDSCGPYSDTLTASGVDKCFSKTVAASVTSSCPGANNPAISIEQQCPTSPTPIGGTLTFTATVRNTGNITLTDIVVVNDRPSANTTVLRVPALPPGGVTNFTGSFPVPSNFNDCTIANTLLVTANNKCGGPSIADSVTTTCQLVSAPAIEITKTCPTTAVAPGSTFTFSGLVANTGNTTLSNITVVVDRPAQGTVVFTTSSLAPGASAPFTGSYTAPLDECSVSDTLSVTALDRCGNAVSDSTTTTCPLSPTPNVAITRACPEDPVAPGQPLVFTGWITNTGNITLTNVTIVVDRPNPETMFFGPVTLSPGQFASFSGSFIVPTNLNSCSISSTLTVRGNNKCTGTVASANAVQSCAVLTSPKIVVTKACPPNPVAQGATLTFTGTVVNTGDITLTNIVVVNSMPTTNTVVFRAGSLAPGQSTNFTGSYTVPGNCCTVTDTLTASAQDACTGTEVGDTATAICPVIFTPRIEVTKDCPVEPAVPGEPLTYSGTVSNAGNITLTDVVVYNDITGPTNPILGIAALAPGEAMAYTASFTVPNDFCSADTVTAAGLSICGDVSVVDSVTSACPVETSPSLAITRSCPNVPILKGQPVTFTATLLNTGNVTLTNITVVNSLPAPNTPVFGPARLGPGQGTNFLFTYTAPVDCNCCELVDTLTARAKDRCSGREVIITATTVCKYETHPALTTAVECPAAGTIGAIIQVPGIVMNTGDITLTNVIVTSGSTRLVGPITLARGETQDFTVDYVFGQNLQVTATATDPCSLLQVTASDACGQSGGAPVIATPGTSGQNVTLTWSSIADVTYRVQYSVNLTTGVWQDVPGDVVAQGSSSSKVVPMATDSLFRYYRVVVVP